MLAALALPGLARAESIYGLHFDGRTYVVVSNALDLRLDDSYTVEMWVNPAPGSGNYGLLNKGNTWVGGAKCLSLGGYVPFFALCNVSHSSGGSGPNLALEAGKWSHVAWTARNLGGDQREYCAYVNGEFNRAFTNVTLPDEGFIELGRYANCCDGFVGDMADVRFWNVVRTAEEMRRYMLAPPVLTTNLVAHWLYWGGNGTVVADRLGAHDGVLMGAGTNAWLPINPAPGVVDPSLQGLWVGEATVSKVSRAPTSDAVTNRWDNTPAEAAQNFPLRLIVHVDAEGGMRLLPEAYLAGYKEWVTVNNTSGNALTNSTDQAAVSNQVWRYRVYTSAGNIPEDRREQVQRVSAAGFAAKGPIILFGATNCFSGRVEMAHDDPLNPFVHAYHPDHDNKDANGYARPAGVESYAIARQIMLQFEDQNPDSAADPHWKVDRWGGTYHETIEGVHRYPLHVEGAFRLQKAGSVGSIE